MFWEKADYEDSDAYSAFRKRQKEKMKLRKKVKYERESYYKMFDLRQESVHVLKILQFVWKREGLKKAMHMADYKSYELQFESALREKGLNKAASLDGFNSASKDLNVQSGEQALPFHIPEYRHYHPAFSNRAYPQHYA